MLSSEYCKHMKTIRRNLDEVPSKPFNHIGLPFLLPKQMILIKYILFPMQYILWWYLCASARMCARSTNIRVHS